MSTPYQLLQRECDRLSASLLVSQTMVKITTDERDAARRDYDGLIGLVREAVQTGSMQHLMAVVAVPVEWPRLTP